MSKEHAKQRILAYMKEHGSISQAESSAHLGCTRLASRICDLRKAEYPIADRWVYSQNRFGEMTRHKEYYLEEN